MSTYGKKEKVCAACIHWKGERNVDFSFIEAIKKQGKCMSEEAFYNLTTSKGCSCGCFKSIYC
ncbi:hypothetical protein [Clostridium omnivorum]|uniref:Uncharacterized protein n=1 Tax=Clostridium omnivorum TaxID=1604902 RepID=A0ABQ5N6J8_9CLOT|nr:hypothetical protein [Clostridium sp. E14]GLC30751.1 hypothetical protein bsdE14_21610 [Clostridium sp. E14]